jgi:hypothetical protein
VPSLFHVSDAAPVTVMRPRPSPPGTPHEGRPLVWAVDEEHLVNYLLPRQCPRVTWAARGCAAPLLGSPARRVVAIEHGWGPRLLGAGLSVHRLDPASFTVLDAGAGYWVSEREAAVAGVRRVDDCFAAVAGTGAELRLTPTLWPYVDAVREGAGEFSAIRMRNAVPRQP